jgi:ABC-type phosphate/phosphonate transport system substrate-binding protein
VKTYEKVIEALKNGQQTRAQISVNALVPASQVTGALRTLQSKGVVGYTVDEGRTFFYLTGVGI